MISSPPTAWLRRLFVTLRVDQWTLNLFVFIALIFSGRLFQADLVIRSTLLALSFCLASSSLAMLETLLRPRVGQPVKLISTNRRPLWFLIIASLGVLSLAIALTLENEIELLLVMVLFFGSQIAYRLYLRKVVIVHLMLLALGVVLRVVAGALVIFVTQLSPWLYICVSLLALFLAIGRVRQQFIESTEEEPQPSSVLSQYTLVFLDHLLSLVLISSLIAYTFYSFQAETALAGGGRMLITTPFVFYGLARYLYLIHVRKLGGAPDDLLFQDRPLLVTSLLWILSVVLLIYSS